MVTSSVILRFRIFYYYHIMHVLPIYIEGTWLYFCFLTSILGIFGLTKCLSICSIARRITERTIYCIQYSVQCYTYTFSKRNFRTNAKISNTDCLTSIRDLIIWYFSNLMKWLTVDFSQHFYQELQESWLIGTQDIIPVGAFRSYRNK